MYEEKQFDFGKHGAFFAIGNEQLQEELTKRGGTEKDYCSMGAGLVAKKENAKTLWKKFETFNKGEREKRLQQDGIESIIKYELSNYESYYTRDISDALAILKGYGATEKQVQAVFEKEAPKQDL